MSENEEFSNHDAQTRRWERIEAYCFHKMNAAETNDTAKEHIGLALFTKPRFKHAETIDPLVWDSCEKILIWPVEERQMLDWIRVLRQYTIGQIYPMSTNQTQNFIKVSVYVPEHSA